MTNTLEQNPITVRDVLYEFSLAREVPDSDLLDEFIRRYPEHAVALTEFAIELVVDSLRPEKSAAAVTEIANVSPAVSRAMSKFQNALYTNQAKALATKGGATQAPATNPFASLDRQAFRQLAQDLNANSVFVCKLRDRQVDPKTMTEGFLQLLANKLKCLRETVSAYFFGTSQPTLQPQFYKSEQQPEHGLQQSFEDAVRDSALTEEQQRYLSNL